MHRFLRWDPQSMSVHVAAMDTEHEQLIGIMNHLFDADVRGRPKEEILHILDDLIAFTKKHFDDEEEFMAAIGFPGLGSHAMVHKHLLERLEAEKAEYADCMESIPDSMFEFLKFWLMAHIQGVDQEYAKFKLSQMPEVVNG